MKFNWNNAMDPQCYSNLISGQKRYLLWIFKVLNHYSLGGCQHLQVLDFCSDFRASRNEEWEIKDR